MHSPITLSLSIFMELDTIHHCEHRKRESGIMLLHVADMVMAQARTTELEEALAQSLARLKDSDIQT